ncbi:recombinase family protein [Vibrio parahaemolyticus]|nr:recombinase family protein [Vibrio parahaemolyticus]
MKTAYSYIRFSTKRQEVGDSIARQIERHKNWCEFNNVMLSELTFDDRGISAYKLKRREKLELFIEMVESGEIEQGSYLLVENTDRLSRRPFLEALTLLHRLVATGIELVIVSSNTVYNQSNINQLSTNLPFLLDADRAHMESERKSMMVKAAKAKLRDNSIVRGAVPMWITMKDDKPEFNEHLKTIQLIVELRKQGKSNQKIAQELNRQHYTTRKGGQWGSTSVDRQYRNTALYGARTWTEAGRVVKIESNVFPAVVSKEVFDAITRKTHKRGVITGVSRTSRYSGLMKCRACGAALTIRTQTHNGKRYDYRKCVNSLEGKCELTDAYKSVDAVLDRAFREMTYVVSKTSADTGIFELSEQLKELEESLIFIRHPVAKARVYDEIAALQDSIAEAEQRPVYDEIELAKLLDGALGNAEINLKLKRIVERIVIRANGRGRAVYTIDFKDAHRKTFCVTHKRGGEFELSFVSDSEKLKNYDASSELRDWEL